MRLRCILPFWIFLFSFGTFCTQAQIYQFDHFSVARGLPISTANHSIFSDKGYYYIATEGGGLAYFDGRVMSAYAPEKMPSVYINQVHQSQDNLLLATANGLYSMHANRFSTLVDSVHFTCFCTDTSGRVYAGSQAGLWIQEDSDWKVQHTELRIRSCAWLQDTLYLATTSGIYALDPQGGLQQTSVTLNTRILTTVPNTNTLIIGALEGAFVWDPNHNQPASSLVDFPFPDVRGIAISDSTIWLGSYERGIASVSVAYPYETTSHITMQNGLPSDRVRSLLVDPFGKLWISSVSGWSKLIHPAITNYIRPDAQDVQVLLTTGATQHYFGGSFGLERLPALAQTPLTIGNVFSIHHQQKTKTIWVGAETGLFRIEKNTVKPFSGKKEAPLSFVLSLTSIGDSLIIGTAAGTFLLHRQQISALTADGLPMGSVTDLAITDTHIYMHVIGNGLYAWDRFTNFAALVPQTDRINIATVVAIDNQVWLGTNGEGLFVYENNQLLARYKTEQGLLSNNVWAVTPASKNRVWLGTEKGLQEIALDNKSIAFRLKIIKEDGLLQQEINRGALYFNEMTQTLLVGTAKGYTQILVSQLEQEPLAPSVHIRSVNLFFQPLLNGVDNHATLVQDITLPYDKNYLSFEFTATSGFNDVQLEYRYILEGQDQNWTPAIEKRDAIFTNIQPGKYTFRVQGKDPLGNVGEARFSFVIKPAFWQTLWFYVLLFALLGGGVYLYIRQRIITLNEKLALESQKAEWERKALRLQMNPHFIFNALDGITGFIFKNDTKSAVKYLSSFAKLMRLTLESSRESFIPLETEIQILKNYLSLEQLRFSNQFDYDIQVDAAIDRYGTLPPMMLQPHVENAILHGLRPLPEGKKGKITIAFSSDTEDTLRCVITDNGIGRVAAAELKAAGKTRHKSLASTITQNRITLFERTYGKGFEFEIEDRVAPDGSALGTSVYIVLPFREDEDAF